MFFLQSVDSVDLTRYMGEWYEIALLPNRFQSMCVADTQASYRLDGDVVRVRNRCRRTSWPSGDSLMTRPSSAIRASSASCARG